MTKRPRNSENLEQKKKITKKKKLEELCVQYLKFQKDEKNVWREIKKKFKKFFQKFSMHEK